MLMRWTNVCARVNDPADFSQLIMWYRCLYDLLALIIDLLPTRMPRHLKYYTYLFFFFFFVRLFVAVVVYAFFHSLACHRLLFFNIYFFTLCFPAHQNLLTKVLLLCCFVRFFLCFFFVVLSIAPHVTSFAFVCWFNSFFYICARHIQTRLCRCFVLYIILKINTAHLTWTILKYFIDNMTKWFF